jgi:hypothetical protein
MNSRFTIKLKTNIGKSQHSVSVAGRMSNAVNKASYLEIWCRNALSTCTKVVDLLFLNYVVKKVSKIASKLSELWKISQQPVKYLKCDNVARNIDFRISAVNKASYLEIFCCNALSTCPKVADLSILNNMVKKCRKSIFKIGGVVTHFPVTFKLRHCCWKYGSQQR